MVNVKMAWIKQDLFGVVWWFTGFLRTFKHWSNNVGSTVRSYLYIVGHTCNSITYHSLSEHMHHHSLTRYILHVFNAYRYEKTPIQIYWKFFDQKRKIFRSLRKHSYSKTLQILQPKKENFQIKISDIFYISSQNIDCGYLLEPPRRGGSNEYPQSMFF